MLPPKTVLASADVLQNISADTTKRCKNLIYIGSPNYANPLTTNEQIAFQIKLKFATALTSKCKKMQTILIVRLA